jgi:hypothetical protein
VVVFIVVVLMPSARFQDLQRNRGNSQCFLFSIP